MSAFGTRVQWLLREAGKDATWLHLQTGIAHSTISNWFSNPDVMPKPSSVARVARALQVSVESLAPVAGYVIRASVDDDERAKRRSEIVESRPRLARQIDRIGKLESRQEDTLISMIEAYLATIPPDRSPEESQ